MGLLLVSFISEACQIAKICKSLINSVYINIYSAHARRRPPPNSIHHRRQIEKCNLKWHENLCIVCCLTGEMPPYGYSVQTCQTFKFIVQFELEFTQKICSRGKCTAIIHALYTLRGNNISVFCFYFFDVMVI